MGEYDEANASLRAGVPARQPVRHARRSSYQSGAAAEGPGQTRMPPETFAREAVSKAPIEFVILASPPVP